MAKNQIFVELDHPPIDGGVWDDWQRQFGNPFHSTCYVDALVKMGWRAVYAAEINTSGALVSAAMAVVRTKAGQKWANFFSEPVTIGGSYQSLLSVLVDKLNDTGVSVLQTSGSLGRWNLNQNSPAQDSNRVISKTPFGTYQLNLLDAEEILWGKMHSKHRNSVRSAQKAKVAVVEKTKDFKPDEIDEFYDLLSDTLKRGQAAVTPRDYFAGIATGLLANGFAKLFMAYSDSGELLSCALIPYCIPRGYYWMGASQDSQKVPAGTGNLIQWQVISSLKKAGVQVYDFGGARPDVKEGSKLSGIQKFKERFGGEFVPHELWQMDLNWKGPLLRLAQKLLK